MYFYYILIYCESSNRHVLLLQRSALVIKPVCISSSQASSRYYIANLRVCVHVVEHSYRSQTLTEGRLCMFCYRGILIPNKSQSFLK